MAENNANTNEPASHNNDMGHASVDYLHRAAQACAEGDSVLGMHLYLAAYENATHGAYMPGHAAVDGLRKAWHLACRLKERSIAEYIFEKLEPYLQPDEVAHCAEQLQRLALDKLEEFGLSREDLEDMAEMISQDFLGISSMPLVMRIEQHADDSHLKFNAGMFRRSATSDATNLLTAGRGEAEEELGIVPSFVKKKDDAGQKEKQDKSKASSRGDAQENTESERLSYQDLVGYRDAIDTMRRFGVGMQNDASFQDLVKILNLRHGLSAMPIIDTYLFRAPVREDANRFMAATLGEIGLPAIRMRMEENLQGMPVLCVMAQTDHRLKLNNVRSAFEESGVLILEDIDLWGSPFSEMSPEEIDAFSFAQLSRGAREAINLIRAAVEDPDVYVLASAGGEATVDPFFFDLLDPVTVVDINDPSDVERADLWACLAQEHPSIHGVDREQLVRYSSGMSRYDICMAAREVVEDAYKESLIERRFIPVSAQALFEKLAAYQPLDSDEYRQLEDAVVEDFRSELDHLDDLLRGE